MIEGRDFIQAETCMVDCKEAYCLNQAEAHNGEVYCVACKYYHEEEAAGIAYDEMSSTALYSRAFRNNADITPAEDAYLFGGPSHDARQKAHDDFVNRGKQYKLFEDLLDNM